MIRKIIEITLDMDENKEIDYKEQDRQAILDYLKECDSEVDVVKVLSESGANRLRVYPLLYEMQLMGQVVVTKENDLGTPERVKLA